MLEKALAKRPVNRASDINDSVMVVQDVDAFLLSEVDWLGGGLLLAEKFRFVAPDDKITLPVHAE